MKRIFKNFYPYTEELYFIGTTEEFKELVVREDKLFEFTWYSSQKFEMKPQISVGVAIAQPFLIYFPILVYGKIVPKHENQLKIELYTKFRGELVAILVFLLTFIGVGIAHYIISLAFALILITPAILLIMSYIYRGQEISIINELKKIIHRYHLHAGKIKINKKHSRR